MQKVACPTTIVRYDRSKPQKVKHELIAMPVRIPGRAMGSTSRNEIVSLPKNRKRCTPKAAAEPSATAMPVASSAALTDSQSASRISWLCQVWPNHLVDSPEIGQPCTFDGLNA